MGTNTRLVEWQMATNMRLVEWQHVYSEVRRKILSVEGKFKSPIETENKKKITRAGNLFS